MAAATEPAAGVLSHDDDDTSSTGHGKLVAECTLALALPKLAAATLLQPSDGSQRSAALAFAHISMT